MADKCSFSAEWHSTAIIHNNLILAHADWKEIDLGLDTIITDRL